MEEHKNMKSKVAQDTRMKFGREGGGENMDDLLYDEEDTSSKGGGGQLATINEHGSHVPLIGGRHNKTG